MSATNSESQGRGTLEVFHIPQEAFIEVLKAQNLDIFHQLLDGNFHLFSMSGKLHRQKGREATSRNLVG